MAHWVIKWARARAQMQSSTGLQASAKGNLDSYTILLAFLSTFTSIGFESILSNGARNDYWYYLATSLLTSATKYILDSSLTILNIYL
jgi:hypothetical protein